MPIVGPMIGAPAGLLLYRVFVSPQRNNDTNDVIREIKITLKSNEGTML